MRNICTASGQLHGLVHICFTHFHKRRHSSVSTRLISPCLLVTLELWRWDPTPAPDVVLQQWPDEPPALLSFLQGFVSCAFCTWLWEFPETIWMILWFILMFDAQSGHFIWIAIMNKNCQSATKNLWSISLSTANNAWLGSLVHFSGLHLFPRGCDEYSCSQDSGRIWVRVWLRCQRLIVDGCVITSFKMEPRCLRKEEYSQSSLTGKE